MTDLSKLIVGIATGGFIFFGLYYGVFLKNEYDSGNSDVSAKVDEITKDKPILDNNPDVTVFNQIYADPELSTFAYWAKQINIENEFNSNDKVSVLAPSNNALSAYKIEEKISKEDTQQILNFLNNHIIKDSVDFTSIRPGDTKSYKSVSGININISKNETGNILINDKLVNSVENTARNGIFYILDFVISESAPIPNIPNPSEEVKEPAVQGFSNQ